MQRYGSQKITRVNIGDRRMLGGFNIITTKSGKVVFENYKDNICCEDKDNKALTEKAKKDINTLGKTKNYPRLGNYYSEDALTWSVFRTLELNNKMSIFYNLVGLDDTLQKTIFWTRDTKTEEIDPLLKSVLNEIEPEEFWKQQTEPDVILLGYRTVVFNESKLGEANTKVLGWTRKDKFEKNDRHYKYTKYLDGMFNEYFKNNFEVLGVKFYQLMRNVIIGKCYAEKLRKEFHLSVIVNELNTTFGYTSHKAKFEEFATYLIDNTKVHFSTWQEVQKAIFNDSIFTKLSKHLESRII